MDFLKIFPNSILQFHGDEEEDFCKSFNKPYIKAINISNQENLVNDLNRFKDAYAFYLIQEISQTRGGTGKLLIGSLYLKNFQIK